jgi:DNA invertase Pin-like site-specific DNA recombinase
MTTTKRCAVYTRVSTAEQKADLQLDELRQYAKFKKWQIVGTFSDTISGIRDKRPALDRMMAEARKGAFDVILIWKFDRFARNTRFLLEAVEEFQSLGLDFTSLQDNVDTSTSMGKAVVTILGAIAELERSTLTERVRAGQRAAMRRGVRFGRPRAEVNAAKVKELRRAGLSWRAVGAELNLATDTCRKALEQ